MYDATRYQVIGHGDWVASHGTGQCAGSEPVASARMEPFAKSPTTIRETDDHHSQNRMPPVVPARHSFVKAFEKKPLIEASVSESQDQTQQQDQKRAPFLNSKKQSQEQPQHPPSEWKEPTETEYISALGRSYPGQEIPDEDAVPPSLETVIANAVRRDGGQTIADGLLRWRFAYHRWLPECRKRIPTPEQWFSEAHYLKEPAEWAEHLEAEGF